MLNGQLCIHIYDIIGSSSNSRTVVKIKGAQIRGTLPVCTAEDVVEFSWVYFYGNLAMRGSDAGCEE